MRRRPLFLALATLAAAFVAAAAWRPPAGAIAADAAHCAAPRNLTTIDAAFDKAAARIAAEKQLTIVAVGSSSTLGTGASSPALSYPSRLEAMLRAALPGVAVKVVNRGVGGQDVTEEVARLQRDVVELHPDLAIWQLGTNAVLRRDDLAADDRLIGRGVALLTENRIPVVLMDLQYAPRVLGRPAYAEMERLIAETARRSRIGLFHRFAIMQRWAQTGQLEPAAMIAADGLHMTDASYGCLALELAEALVHDLRAAPSVGAPGGQGAARIAGMPK